MNNPLIKRTRGLRNRKLRSESRLFLVEGLYHVGQAVEAGWQIDSLLFAPDLLTSSFGRELVQRFGPAAHAVSVPVMRSLADKENPQGLLAVVRQRAHDLPTAADEFERVVALVSPQDPGNVGTILRTMDAVGADALFLLDGGVELYHPSTLRASMGTLFWIPVIQSSFEAFIEWARGAGFQLIGTSARAEMESQTFVPRLPWVLILGNEQKGLSQEQTSASDLTVSLPMRGRVSSLNLAVAAGVLLYHLTRREGG